MEGAETKGKISGRGRLYDVLSFLVQRMLALAVCLTEIALTQRNAQCSFATKATDVNPLFLFITHVENVILHFIILLF